MATQLYKIDATGKAGGKGVFPLQVSFFDESTPPVAVIPNAITWSLYDEAGAIVNSRTSVVVTPAAVVNIVPFGDDLALPDATKPTRRLLLQYDYNSTFGTNLPVKVEYIFEIENLTNVN